MLLDPGKEPSCRDTLENHTLALTNFVTLTPVGTALDAPDAMVVAGTVEVVVLVVGTVEVAVVVVGAVEVDKTVVDAEVCFIDDVHRQ